MKTILTHMLLVASVLFTITVHGQNVAINNNGTSADASAMLDIQSNSKGVLIPRLTTAQRIAIASPATGLLVFDTNTGSFWFRKATGWQELIDKSNSPWEEDGSLNVRTKNGGNVSIAAPGAPAGNGKLNVVEHGSSTNTTESMLQLYRSTTGTAAPGIGGSIDFFNELSNGIHTPTAKIISESVNVTPGSYASSMEFLTAASGFLTTQLYIGPTTVGIGTTLPTLGAKLDVNGNINTNGKFIRGNVTGINNLVPLCYGAVDQIGNILGGTGNFTVLKTSTGIYYIQNASITAGCIVIATPRASSIGNIAPRSPTSAVETGAIYITTFNSSGVLVDYGFDFIIYKP